MSLAMKKHVPTDRIKSGLKPWRRWDREQPIHRCRMRLLGSARTTEQGRAAKSSRQVPARPHWTNLRNYTTGAKLEACDTVELLKKICFDIFIKIIRSKNMTFSCKWRHTTNIQNLPRKIDLDTNYSLVLQHLTNTNLLQIKKLLVFGAFRLVIGRKCEKQQPCLWNIHITIQNFTQFDKRPSVLLTNGQSTVCKRTNFLNFSGSKNNVLSCP